jgi:hypothetical protein
VEIYWALSAHERHLMRVNAQTTAFDNFTNERFSERFVSIVIN